MIKNKFGIQVSFSWLFAIVVGGFILFLAIYGATRAIDRGGDISSARVGNEIGVLLNPLETGFESGQVTLISMPVDTRINNLCEDITGYFGEQIIRASQKNFGEWAPTDIDAKFKNKYIFSEGEMEGKSFFVFSKPFNLPFKVADLIYMTSTKENYCFRNAPRDIVEELENLNQENIIIDNCKKEDKKICFSSSSNIEGECDILVNQNSGEVQKDGKILYFEGDALMYAAIFSERGIYECQISRLMKRARELVEIYIDKSEIISSEGCSADVNLFSLRSLTENFEDSEDIFSIVRESERVTEDNERARCELW